MRVQVELSETELRYLVMNHLNAKLGGNISDNIYDSRFEVKMTYGEKENWRKPKYLRVYLEREVA